MFSSPSKWIHIHSGAYFSTEQIIIHTILTKHKLSTYVFLLDNICKDFNKFIIKNAYIPRNIFNIIISKLSCNLIRFFIKFRKINQTIIINTIKYKKPDNDTKQT